MHDQAVIPLPPLPPNSRLRWKSNGPGHIEITRVPAKKPWTAGAVLLSLLVIGLTALLLVPESRLHIWVIVEVGIGLLVGLLIVLSHFLESRQPAMCGVAGDELWAQEPQRFIASKRIAWPKDQIRRIHRARVFHETPDGLWHSHEITLAADFENIHWLTTALKRHLRLADPCDEFAMPPPPQSTYESGTVLPYTVGPTTSVEIPADDVTTGEKHFTRQVLPDGATRLTIIRQSFFNRGLIPCVFFFALGLFVMKFPHLLEMFPRALVRGAGGFISVTSLWTAAAALWQSRTRISADLSPGHATLYVRTPWRTRITQITEAAYPLIWPHVGQLRAQTPDGQTVLLLSSQSINAIRYLHSQIQQSLGIPALAVAGPASPQMIPAAPPPLPPLAKSPLIFEIDSADRWRITIARRWNLLIVPAIATLLGLIFSTMTLRSAGFSAFAAVLFGWIIGVLIFRGRLLAAFCESHIAWNDDTLRLSRPTLFGRETLNLNRWAIARLRIIAISTAANNPLAHLELDPQTGRSIPLLDSLPESQIRYTTQWIAASLGMSAVVRAPAPSIGTDAVDPVQIG